MKHFKYFILGGLALATSALVACGSSSSSTPTSSVCAPGTTATASGCVVTTLSTIPNAQYFNGMMSIKFSQYMANYINAATQQQYASQLNGYSYFTQSYAQNSLSIQNGYGTFLQETLGICNIADHSGGNADCNNWASQGTNAISIMPSGNSVVLRIVSLGDFNTYYSYSVPNWKDFLLGMFGIPVLSSNTGSVKTTKMALNGSINPINNSAGFEIDAYPPTGTTGYNKLIQLKVNNGTVGDSSANFVLIYNNNQIASGTLQQCGGNNCQNITGGAF